jgi:hypothetical protein
LKPNPRLYRLMRPANTLTFSLESCFSWFQFRPLFSRFLNSHFNILNIRFVELTSFSEYPIITSRASPLTSASTNLAFYTSGKWQYWPRYVIMSAVKWLISFSMVKVGIGIPAKYIGHGMSCFLTLDIGSYGSSSPSESVWVVDISESLSSELSVVSSLDVVPLSVVPFSVLSSDCWYHVEWIVYELLSFFVEHLYMIRRISLVL